MTNKAKSLYIHIPFCENLCDYCDFPKLQYFRIYAKKYISILINEIESFNIKHQLDTIYIGGGTPTALEDDLFEELLIYLNKYVNKNIEYTVEANPESLSLNKIKLMKKYGVNRLSIGVESTNDEVLSAINRKHTFLDVINSYHLARNNGFNNISFDLILGLPNVSLKMLENDIKNIIKLSPEHISCYSLTVHPNTIFSIKGIDEPNENFSREGYDLIHNLLEKSGYIHYEISNWSKPNYNSRHNFAYWNNDRYYGAGLGAAGYILNFRYKNTRSMTKYLANIDHIIEKEYLNNKDIRDYAIILNLRTNKGIDLDKFKNDFQEDLLNDYKDVISELISQNLLYLDTENNRLIATYEGFMLLDTIILKFI